MRVNILFYPKKQDTCIMTSALLYLPCLPNINWLQNFVKYENVMLEREENFVKSSFRNRYEIGGANGKQILTIPLQGGRDHHRLYKNTKIAYTGHWQKKHWQAICTAYGSAPFFEFYAHKFQPFFETETENLFEYNLGLLNVVLAALKLKKQFELTMVYDKASLGYTDLRNDKAISGIKYYQVFSERVGNMPNLCALDLIFNEGTRSQQVITV
jgi:hypothetical protein